MRAPCHAPAPGRTRSSCRPGPALRPEWDNMFRRPATSRASRFRPFPVGTFMTQTCSVFFVSDGTGITAETLGHSLLAQFPDTRFRHHRKPFIDSPDKARDCVQKIRDAAVSGLRPIVFNTLVDPDAVAAPARSGCPLPRPLREVHRTPGERAGPAFDPRRRPFPRHRRQPGLQASHRGDQPSPTTTASPTPT